MLTTLIEVPLPPTSFTGDWQGFEDLCRLKETSHREAVLPVAFVRESDSGLAPPSGHVFIIDGGQVAFVPFAEDYTPCIDQATYLDDVHHANLKLISQGTCASLKLSQLRFKRDPETLETVSLSEKDKTWLANNIGIADWESQKEAQPLNPRALQEPKAWIYNSDDSEKKPVAAVFCSPTQDLILLPILGSRFAYDEAAYLTAPAPSLFKDNASPANLQPDTILGPIGSHPSPATIKWLRLIAERHEAPEKLAALRIA